MTTLPEALSNLSRPEDTACTQIENLLGEPFKVAGDVLADQVPYVLDSDFQKGEFFV